MGDKELLELAAKSSGLDIRAGQNGILVQWSPELRGYIAWNPLVDDGDALRLAVQLKFDLDLQSSTENTIFVGLIGQDAFFDPYVATRRAIVRAAAEIGKLKTLNV